MSTNNTNAEEHRRMTYWVRLFGECLRVTTDVDEALAAADLAFSLQPEPPKPSKTLPIGSLSRPDTPA